MDNQPFSEVQEPIIIHHEAPPVLKHSGLGIASFILAIIAIVLVVALIIVTAVIAKDELADIALSQGNLTEEQIKEFAPLLIVIFLTFFGSVILSLVGAILGIVGLLQKNRKKLFAILGTLLNSLGWIIIIILIVVGTFSNMM